MSLSLEAERARRELSRLGDRHARPRAARWSPVSEAQDRAIARDHELRDAAAAARRSLAREVVMRLGGLVAPEEATRFAGALLAVPRERFVLPEDIGSSADDAPSPLDAEGLATVSAPHAYVLTYCLLGLDLGDHLVELGTGTGYGAALASHLVGPRGQVTSIEIDPALHTRARRLLAALDARGDAPIDLHEGDARELAPPIVAEAATRWQPLRVAVTYALPDVPEALLATLPEGGRLVAPVGTGEDDQLLYRWSREGGVLHRAVRGPVRYVAERA